MEWFTIPVFIPENVRVVPTMDLFLLTEDLLLGQIGDLGLITAVPDIVVVTMFVIILAPLMVELRAVKASLHGPNKPFLPS